MKNGFFKAACVSPALRVADTAYNASVSAKLANEAAVAGAALAVFPELGLTGYTCADLFYSDTLLKGAENGLCEFLRETAQADTLCLVGLPAVWNGKLYNCAAVCLRGTLLGVVPKTNVPNYGEFYELRQFTPAEGIPADAVIDLCGVTVPFGTKLLFTCREHPALCVAAEICEDLWVAVPPSAGHAAAGATVLCNLSASNETIGKDSYRRTLVTSQAARCSAAYLYASCGDGESTTDMVFSGHCMICENGTVLAEKRPFDRASPILLTELDVDRLAFDRRRMNTHIASADSAYRRIFFSLPARETVLTRFVDPHPFVPADARERSTRCETILSIQAGGLRQRIDRTFAKKVVVGISGGLDSTLALLVMVRAMDSLSRPRKDIIAVTMPCFGTTKRTKNNATVLCEELGVDFRCVDIFDAVSQHFKDIGHDPKVLDVAYENCQARERTQVLMDIANDCGGMVIGTGDLSELALGWATYNGDHMSMYGVNASVPKTLVRHIVSYCAGEYRRAGEEKLAAALEDVLATPVSPELLPAGDNGEIAQKTEDLVGPYELHDFYLYYMLRFGFGPEKLYRLARYALGDVYDAATCLKWLKIFIRRFFSQQFKRSCLPDGPKVGSVALSPRGDWRMPSDACAALWTKEAEALQAEEGC